MTNRVFFGILVIATLLLGLGGHRLQAAQLAPSLRAEGSITESAARMAKALERIADALERQSGARR